MSSTPSLSRQASLSSVGRSRSAAFAPSTSGQFGQSKSGQFLRTSASGQFLRRTNSRIGSKLVVRQSALSQLFFPQEAHKKHIIEAEMEEVKKKREKEAKKRSANEPVEEGGVPSKEPTEVGDEEEEGEFLGELQTIRGKIVWAIHSHTVQTVLLVLLLLDVFVVIAELIIAGHTECHVETAHGCPHHHDPLIHNSTGWFPPTGCGVHVESELPHSLHTAEVALTWISRAILIIFAAELFMLLCCLGRRFFTVVYTLDAIIVGVSLALSFTLESESSQQEASLIIFLRCWRFARILHGFGLTVHEVEETDYEEIEHEKEDLSEKVHVQRRELHEMQFRVAEYEQLIKKALGEEAVASVETSVANEMVDYDKRHAEPDDDVTTVCSTSHVIDEQGGATTPR